MIVNDAPSVLAACLSGHGIAQPLDLYSREALRSKQLIRVQEFADYKRTAFNQFLHLNL
jgi:DNA-binding transcriptional LysR family regulator